MTRESERLDHYRLLYFSPRPEDGERICVAVLVSVGGRYRVEFDEKLTKMKSIAREHDTSLVRDVLENLRAEIGFEDPKKIIAAIEPQFRLSEPRRLLVEWSDEVERQLRRRFILRKRHPSGIDHDYQHELGSKLREFTSRIAPGWEHNFIEGLKPDQLFGKQIAHDEFRSPKAITRAVVGRTRAVLIDAVDTAVGDSTEIIQRANRIAFTFWQYGEVTRKHRISSSGQSMEIVRVGVVFDGQPKSKVLRDYSLHQFNKDADFAIEADADKSFTTVRAEINKTLEDIRI